MSLTTTSRPRRARTLRRLALAAAVGGAAIAATPALANAHRKPPTAARGPREGRSSGIIRPALAIAAGALTLAVAPMLASPASALAAPNVVGAFANVHGAEPLNQTVSMPLSTSFNSATGSGERGTIRHGGAGIYHVTFNGLVPKDPNGGFLDPGGVVHVRTRTGKVCHAPQGQAGIVGTK
jgi:hypothetical protein